MKQTPIHDAAGLSHRSPIKDTSEENTFDLGGLAGKLWREKWIIALCTTAAILFGMYYAFVASVPLYRSTAVVILEIE
ncbi:Wzz/FepE/Etk N-terminal domain-containing protein [Ruegeria sp. A3M17]|uniref:Wzz/FepE/Etk N-terminal domain-containing protein n=1 Tax=Ruegeria sp. A3M17 TaxID=2267229 RepID=UPI001F356459|nr:Wzz/FepE/Etk N-terminal domain-containing protein [Ruegeria sp. A3M17]